MKSETIHYFVPPSFQFTGTKMGLIRAAWIEQLDLDKDTTEEMTEEDILSVADNLGLISLPDGWKA